MQKLPLGKQDFADMRQKDYLYVDKTEHIYRLIETAQYYFMSRPRRFGKSLLISTLKELFSGRKELFEGLWIHDKINWQKHPIIHFSFNTLDYKEQGLRKSLDIHLDYIADEHGITLQSETYSGKFNELIRTLGKKKETVILIDEYDKPIIDYITEIPQAAENRDILKNLYSVIKGNEQYIQFLLITGVSKFSQLSIFSDLNHLVDITIDDNFAALTGITEEELDRYFSENIADLQEKHGKQIPDVRSYIRDEYLGYSWDGRTFVYNPFTLLTLFVKQQFGDFWFRSATPSFLMKLVKEQNYSALDILEKDIPVSLLDKYEIEDISLLPLLFQTGYLTIKSFDWMRQIVHLDYPNKEVARAFSIHLLSGMNGGESTKTGSLLIQMTEALEKDNPEKFLQLFAGLLKGIAYPIAKADESYFHSAFYLTARLLGFYIDCEIMTIDGRIDAVVKTENSIYIMEFKTGNTKKAIEQIREKGYHEKYTDDPRHKILVGIDFDAENKKLVGYEIQDV